jgi:hypothetical protein
MCPPSFEDTPGAKRAFIIFALGALGAISLLILWLGCQYGSINKFFGLE